MLQGPLLPALTRLALPTVAVMFLVTLLSVAETYFVSSLGTDGITAASLVVPVVLLMTFERWGRAPAWCAGPRPADGRWAHAAQGTVAWRRERRRRAPAAARRNPRSAARGQDQDGHVRGVVGRQGPI